MLRPAYVPLISAIAALCFGVGAAQAQLTVDGVGADGHRHDTVHFHCSAPSTATCNFMVMRAKGGATPVKVRGQAVETKDDLEVGKDYFTVTIDRDPPLSLSTCRAQMTDTPPCHWGLLHTDINDASH